ncbi:CcdC protein domain-containing protein [Sphingomonas sp. AP4-R1]|uniref:CcdC protein domain-containing protein n=1 Tax=Sphingomonas sp. AP4-R1 TaxID=2735134 RepID=UPI0020A40701|nr:CcdC protein domain-containing protein [Sphingomonas sp. AP4-R1]
MQAHPAPQTITYIITGCAIALVLVLRYRGMRRASRLRLETLWIVPAIFGLAFLFGLYEAPPPTPIGWLWLVVAAAGGGALGWQRGKLMKISVDPATHQLNKQNSPAALLFIVLLIVARQGLRYEAAQAGVNLMKITGILLAFGFGLLSATRAEMYVRAKRLLGAAKSAQLA